ncbi:hypothetical protein DPMN_008071 [Dreissena polymorpha]|uniref:Uncharacterized protein n=1 Tax=Dreissena polymorpha TaxID=45954 RepID=A0A9D4RYX3_DREPO|nr:hypothetical protein DPMN_008071 [Dreissena polymorpha]
MTTVALEYSSEKCSNHLLICLSRSEIASVVEPHREIRGRVSTFLWAIGFLVG